MAQKFNRNPRIIKMTLTAILAALIMLMTFTGIAYIPIGPLKLTINTLPVAIGAVVLGPKAGLVLGGVFGLSSFFTCFGMDPFGGLLLGLNPFFTFLFCVVPRLLCGWLPALIFKVLSAVDSKKILSSAVACGSTAILNTVFFLSFLWLLFGKEFSENASVIEMMGGITVTNIFSLFALMAGTNALIEALSTTILGTAICKALFINKDLSDIYKK